MGKLSTRDLRKLLNCIKKDERVVIPPMPGFDSGVHLLGDKYLVVSTDPCLGVPEKWFGYLLIHYAASDVALFGAKPEFCTINLLGPLSSKPQTFQKIMKLACSAAGELRLAIVTGHTGTYEGLEAPVGVCTAYGTVEKSKLVTPAGAKAGDCIFCIKPVALETIVNFALTNKDLASKLFGRKRTEELADLVPMQSCVNETLLLAETGGVHAMHDATEGGLTAALNEMAEASGVGFKIEFENIPFCKEALKLQQHFKLSDIQLLSMSSTGTFLASVSEEAKSEIEKILRQKNIAFSILGQFTADTKKVMSKREAQTLFPRVARDPYTKILSGKV
ncbi:hypothetical protein KEJ15_00780 [Candidatus Bathyarchaeota archaeon]|nr:hypothetical protein [Candidatus Bathyarchaeota archaeon]